MRKIIFLGTNGWYDTKMGNTVSILIDVPKCYFILDAGNGLYKVDKYIKDDKKPIYLFLSHYHLDHIIGFHFLFKFNFPQGIKVIGQERINQDLEKIIGAPYTVAFKDYKYGIEVMEFNKIKSILPYKAEMIQLKHSKSCVGYRIEVDDEIISYCADTGYCDNAVVLAREADILICECGFKEVVDIENAPHLDPRLAANIAKSANCKKLYLIHFDASIYTEKKDRFEAEGIAKNIFKDSIATFDDMILEK